MLLLRTDIKNHVFPFHKCFSHGVEFISGCLHKDQFFLKTDWFFKIKEETTFVSSLLDRESPPNYTL